MLLKECVTKVTVPCILILHTWSSSLSLSNENISIRHWIMFGCLTLWDYALKCYKSEQITWMVSCLVLWLFKVESRGKRLTCCTWHHPLILAKLCCMLANVTAWQPFSHVGPRRPEVWRMAPAESTLGCLLLQTTLRLRWDLQRCLNACNAAQMHCFS